MPYPTAFLTHKCIIIKRHPLMTPDTQHELNQDTLNQSQTQAQDTYGNQIILSTEVSEKRCRFGTKTANLGDSRYYSTITCTLQATTEISAEDQVLTETPGYAGVYWVNAVRQIYEPTGNRISHTILDLREAEEGVAT